VATAAGRGKIWNSGPQLDAAVIASLMASSRSMAQVVHETCTGRLHARLRPYARVSVRRDPVCEPVPVDVQTAETTQQGRGLTRWFFKAGPLLASLEVDVLPQHDVYIAAALCSSSPAAAARLLMGPPRAAGGARAARGSAGNDAAPQADAAAADANAAAMACRAAVATGALLVLPHLQELTLHLGRGATRCTHKRLHALVTCGLSGLAACTQLTRLQLCCGTYGDVMHSAVAAVLPSLPQLQELSIDAGPLAFSYYGSGNHFSLAACPRLRTLTMVVTTVPPRFPCFILSALVSLETLELPCLGKTAWSSQPPFNLPVSLRSLSVQYLEDMGVVGRAWLGGVDGCGWGAWLGGRLGFAGCCVFWVRVCDGGHHAGALCRGPVFLSQVEVRLWMCAGNASWGGVEAGRVHGLNNMCNE
jgi:hypothetical protein